MRTRLILLAVAVVTAAVMLSFQIFIVGPHERCDRERGVWDDESRSCAHTVRISPMTLGR